METGAAEEMDRQRAQVSGGGEPRAPSGVKQCSLVSSVKTQSGGECRKREGKVEGSGKLLRAGLVKVSDKTHV